MPSTGYWKMKAFIEDYDQGVQATKAIVKFPAVDFSRVNVTLEDINDL
tara:strand:+ start:57 stop:200 length:144 start_codon:yes stop_codon:yes gene_type:complete